MDAREVKERVSRLKTEYQVVMPEVWDEETTGKAALIALNELDTADRTLMMLYTDLQSYRKLGKMLNISHVAIKLEIDRIREQMIDRMEVLKECL